MRVGIEIVAVRIPVRPLPVFRRHARKTDGRISCRTNGSATGIRWISRFAFLVGVTEYVRVLLVWTPAEPPTNAFVPLIRIGSLIVALLRIRSEGSGNRKVRALQPVRRSLQKETRPSRTDRQTGIQQVSRPGAGKGSSLDFLLRLSRYQIDDTAEQIRPQ